MRRPPTILIPAAGRARRMKTNGPKALVAVNGEPLIVRQLRILRQVYPNSEMVVVLGYHAEQVKKVLPRDVTVTVNPHYDSTNVAHSVNIGMRRCRPESPVLLVYGDLVFGRGDIETIGYAGSSAVLVDTREGVRRKEVGVNVVSDMAMCFAYGLPFKWAHIALLYRHEQEMFIRLATEQYRRRHFSYEVFNEIIDQGGSFLAISTPRLNMVEIDSSRDFRFLTSKTT